MKELDRKRATVLSNENCPYCGSDFSLSQPTKEHVIGRRFVPKGTLNGEWNLIFNACEACNSQKGILENDISAIAMYAVVWSRSANPDQRLVEEAARKSKTKSQSTGRPVSDSETRIKLKSQPLPGLFIDIDLEAAPQIEEARIFALARFQLMAFFYFITYREEAKRGGFWLGEFHPVMVAIRENWGNATFVKFASMVVEWEPRIRVFTANENYFVMIRKHPLRDLWSWALEWNKYYRIIGFFGDSSSFNEVMNEIPVPEMIPIATGDGFKFAMIRDVPLEDGSDDLMFYCGKADELSQE